MAKKKEGEKETKILRAQTEEMAAYRVLDSLALPALWIADGLIRHANDAFLDRAGLRDQALAGQRAGELLSRFMPGDVWDALMEAAEAERSGIAAHAALDMGLDGRPAEYQILTQPAPAGQGAILLFEDVTELTCARKEAEASGAWTRAFWAAATHAIRTHMNAVLGFSDMLEEGSPEAGREPLRNIRRAAGELITFVSQAVDFVRLESQDITLVPDCFALDTVLQRLLQKYVPLFQEKDAHLVFVQDGEAPPVVYGDAARLEQALSSSLDAVLRSTRGGSIRLSLSAQADGTLRFAVRGPGMTLTNEEAFMDTPALLERGEGDKLLMEMGLGLANARRLARLMEGDVALTHGAGAALTLFVRLPGGAKACSGTAPEAGGAEGAFTVPDAHVLVVDDNALNLQVAKVLLSSFGARCDTAHSGPEALVMVGENPYDIIFMDQFMPGMDGIETTQRIRTAGGENAAVPVVALTAEASMGAREMFLASGYNDYIAKPLERSVLAACLRRWLPSARVREEGGSDFQ